MNKVHHIVWNKTLSVWQAASENTKSNTKNGKAFRLNTLTSVKALSFLGWFFPQIASAGCDIPAIPASNSVVTCTGTTSGTYTIRNVQNVQLTNEGAWNLSGASFGMVSADTGDLTGLVVTNKGTMTWDNAQYGGSGTGSRAAINVFTTGNAATQATTVNDSVGVINLNVLSSLGNNRALAGMAVYGGGANSRVSWNNAGQINVNSTSNNANAKVVAGVIRGRSQADVVNTGTLTVSELSGNTKLGGLEVYMTGGSTVPVSATLTNSGTILVSSPTASFASGVEMGQVAANSGGLPSSFKLNNSGTIQLDTNPTKGYVVELYSNSEANVFFDINNSGALLAKDSSGWAVVLDGRATQTAKVTLNNTGTIVGNIWTESGNDQVTQTAGSISGDISLGAGSDALIASGGALIGSTYMGAGDDVASLTGTVDVTAAPQFDGGAGLDTLNIDGLKIKGFTAASNDSTGNDLNKGNNLTQWETINLNNAAKLTLTGELFTGANVGILNINSASTLDLTQTTPTAFSVYGDVNNGGIVDMFNNSIGTMTTITGNYAGVAGSTLKMDTVLGNDASATDKLVISGSATGTTYVKVNNENGTGAQTLEGIEVISTGSSTSDAFVQSGRIVAGVYDYHLQQGTTSGSNMNNWYLTSSVTDAGSTTGYTPTLRPEIASYTANLAAANTLFNTRLHDRLGETRYTDVLTGEQKVTSLWLRSQGGRNSATMSDGQNKTTANRYVFQMGGDVAQGSTDGVNRLHLGVMGGYGNQHSSTHNSLTGYGSKGTLEGYSTGVYGTWFQNEVEKTGLYVDSWAQYNWFDNTVKGDGLSEEKYKSRGVTASVESGYTLHTGSYTTAQGMKNDFYLEPQVQLTWSGVKADDHTESNGTHVQGAGNGNLQTRVGTRLYMKGRSALDRETQREFEPFVEVNWIYNSQQYGTRMNGVSDSLRGTRNIGELKTGVEAKLSDNVNLWGSVGQQMGGSGYHDTQGVVGIKALF